MLQSRNGFDLTGETFGRHGALCQDRSISGSEQGDVAGARMSACPLASALCELNPAAKGKQRPNATCYFLAILLLWPRAKKSGLAIKRTRRLRPRHIKSLTPFSCSVADTAKPPSPLPESFHELCYCFIPYVKIALM